FSAAWAIRRGRKRGPYFLFCNHSTRQRIDVNSALRRIVRPRVWPAFMLFVASWASTIFLVAADDAGLDVAAKASSGLTVDGFAWLVLTPFVGMWRARRFKAHAEQRLIDAMNQRAGKIVGAADGWVTPA